MRCCVLEAAEGVFSTSIPNHGKHRHSFIWHPEQIRRSAFHKAFGKKKKRKLLRVEIVGLRKNNVKETQQGLTDFIV